MQERESPSKPSRQEAGGKDNDLEHHSECSIDIAKLERTFQETLNGKEREWRARESELEQHIHRIGHDLQETTRILQAKLSQSESEKLMLQEEHESFIRKQQEASFRRRNP